MVEIKHVSKSYGDKVVLNDISYSFPDRAVTGIVGASGGGKTTLVNIVLGLVKPDSGRVIVNGDRLACVFQDDRLIEHMTATENIRLTAHSGINDSDIINSLSTIGLDPKNRDAVSKYSGGMRRRVSIVRAVLSKPDILALDEPFKGLDEMSRTTAVKYILSNCKDACVLLVTHDREDIELMGARSELVI